MSIPWKSVIWRQFSAAIDMLENAMLACPDDPAPHRPAESHPPATNRLGARLGAERAKCAILAGC